MKNDKIVTINGQNYDKETGLPLDNQKLRPKSTTSKNSGGVKAVHSLSQKTQKLYSRAAQKTFNDIKSSRHSLGRNVDIARSKSISHFAPKSTVSTQKSNSSGAKMDIKPIKHPLAAKTEKKRSSSKTLQAKKPVEKSAKAIKEEVINKALNKTSQKTKSKKGLLNFRNKYFNIFSIGIVILLVAGYFIYLNMPSISVQIASARAGISATYPQYQPDGYRLDGPVSYSNGEVVINFRANTGDSRFVIKQSKSSWDSSAVKLQVDKDSNNETSESKEGGLTIYTYDNNTKAAWVNGGILYAISGDAKLSGEQIRHIATSL